MLTGVRPPEPEGPAACDNSTLSYSGRKRTRAGVSGSGRGASGRSTRARPRRVREGAQPGAKAVDDLPNSGEP